MAAKVRSVDFLPEIFQTPVNQQFLSATLDQLIQEPAYKQTQGYIGQTVGPGVNPTDTYVTEPTAVRNNYQLEPGVVMLNPETGGVNDVITYPGIIDGLSTQGAITDQADRLFESEYYVWDPFVDFDKFNNYAQYYWLPNGPDAVVVSATEIPTQETFKVTRQNGVYTFSGYAGNNPTLTLARNGSYNFDISQANADAIDYRVTNNGTSSWTINFQANPTLTLVRGNTYTWNLVQTAPLAFYIKTELSFGTTNLWNTGVQNNGAGQGLVIFTVPTTAPDTLYYCNDVEFNLRGQFNIVDATPGTGPDFWIQSQPGISGRLPWSPNISSRDVLGVTNNGIDLGTVAFNVPDKTAQSFYTSMPYINYPTVGAGRVNLVAPPTLTYEQINGISVEQFLTAYPQGIDGITSLNSQTLVFSVQTSDPVPGGWINQTPFDPLAPGDIGAIGSYDSTTFSEATPITDPAIQFGLWQIQYVNDVNGVPFIRLNNILSIAELTQFSITSGTEYVNTNWYKNSQGFFQEMPLLTAALSTLFYQDGEDPNIFGAINLIDQATDAYINIDTEILGEFNYTSPKTADNPDGITFTNGLKVTFQGTVYPESYQGNTYYVQGVGSGIILVPETSLIVPESYAVETEIINVTDASGTGSIVTLNYFEQPTTPFAPGQLIIVAGITSVTGNYNGIYTVLSSTTTSLTYSSAAVGEYTSGGNIASYGNQPARQDYITINMASQDLNPWSRSNRWFHIDVINATAVYNDTTPNYVSSERATRPILEFRANTKLFNFAIQGINAVDVIDFTQTDALLNVNGQTSYTINGYTLVQDSTIIFAVDDNLDVRKEVYTVNFIVPNPQGSTVPIIDLIPTTTVLPDQGTVSINGTTLAVQSIKGNGTAAIIKFSPLGSPPFLVGDPVTVRGITPAGYNGIYTVTACTKSTVSYSNTTTATYISGGTVSIVGQSYYYDGTNWILAQQKSNVQEPPLFDVFDSNGYSFGDTTQYPSTNFIGSKLLSYAVNPDNPVDTVLGIPLAFFSINNIGDTLFDNNFYTDTFIYTPTSTGAGQTVNVSDGFVYQYSNLTAFTLETGWQTAAIPSLARQQFQFTYNGQPLQLDVVVETDLNVPAVQIFINNVYQDPSTYTLTTNSLGNTVIILTGTGYVDGDIIEVLVYSQTASAQGFYEVPVNLENNPFNGNSSQFTLGTVRQHYGTICENLLDFQGTINGRNNTRDLGNIIPFGQQILQQSSPLTLAGFFIRNANYDIFGALAYNSQEYTKYKNKILTAVTQLDIQPGQTISNILDLTIQKITSSLTSSDSFYWSDMLPCGSNYTSTSTTVTPITIQTFNTTQMYDFTSSNYQGLLVYFNGVLLLRGTEYTVSTIAPKLTLLVPITTGDVVTINEYIPVLTTRNSTTTNTNTGVSTTKTVTTSTNPSPNWCPNTPSKMGLYPKYKPEIYLDETYSEPTFVIRGHDGSTTIAFGDIRDQLLLEFEKRVYNNIKVDDNPIPLTTEEVDPDFYPAQTTALLPGYFRKTPYTWQEVNQILSETFFAWVGQNKVNYTQQTYVASNPFTYNYRESANRLDQQPFLQGNWRGIYRYFYDTETPNTTPWEMLGFTEEPLWWMERYGPAPYTSGNTVLWGDLEAGLVADPFGPYLLTEYARPGLIGIIPVSSEGDLLNPLECVVGLNDPSGFQQSWQAGDGGPVQDSWWNSSSYPFAIMRLLALTKPAQFFSLFADRDLYRYNTTLGQYLYNNRYRLDANGVQIYGNGVSKASYINWIVDYNQRIGLNSTTSLTNALASIDVRLCYRMASFSDPVYVQLFTERAGPASTNNSLLIPPTSYDLLFYKNQPFNTINYSAVIVQIVELDNGGVGYSVSGYSNINPYFNIFISSPVGAFQTITSGNLSVQVPTQYTNNTTQIPYGYVFTNPASVCDFLLSYGTWLTSQGLTFDNVFNGYTLNWNQMCQEFLYFAAQGWTFNTIINLNPSAITITASQPISIVDTIASVTPENMLLDQNGNALDVSKMVVNRDGNQFSVSTLNQQTINYLTLKFTNYEDMIVLNNTSQFRDLIYNPITAARQSRLSLIASTTTEWDGQLNAQGFILNLNNVKEWDSNRTYAKGEIVLYKNTYWQALVISQPQQTFNYTNWIKSDYQLIDQGLLPNLANKADQLTTAYDVYQANLTSDNDLFAFALIGFRPRPYMTDMNLNGTTQVQLYQQFLGTKGTLQAAEVFKTARINGKESGAYDIYENWGVLSGTYGAQANKSYFEIQLDQSLLSYNPSTIQVIVPGQTSQANQSVYVKNLWKTSYNITSSDILPTTYENSNLPQALPTAGYVCLEDVDVTVFDINDPTAIDVAISTIGTGTYIWIAKINSYNWGVYRVEDVPGQMTTLTDNLNSTAIVQFNVAHGLSYGDLIIIKYFNQGVDGVYRVLAVPSITTIIIEFNFTNTNVNSLTGTGLVFHLQSARVSQASDISTLPYVNSLTPGSIAWVDNDGNGHWETLQKGSPFTINQTIAPGLAGTANFGASVAQVNDNFGALVGAPGTQSGAGSVYTYFNGVYQDYQFNTQLILGTQGTVGYGNAVAFGNYNWGVAGASASNSGAGYAAVIYRDSNTGIYTQIQLLVAPDQNFSPIGFGSSAAISFDERWLYVGAPGANVVYAYEKVEVVEQSITYTANGTQTLFEYDTVIQVDYLNPNQLIVTLNGNIATYGTDYTINENYVIFVTAPTINQILIISRANAVQLDTQTYYGIQQDATSGIGISAIFNITSTRGVYTSELVSGGVSYQVGDTLTIDGTQIGGTAPTDNLIITVTDAASGIIKEYSESGTGTITTSTFTLSNYLYNATSIYNFTVKVNEVLQRPFLDYTFDNTTTAVTFLSGSIPPLGAKIIVSTPTYWQYVETITSASSVNGDQFGASITTTTDGRQIMIGAPNAEVNLTVGAGTVYIFDRSVLRYIVSTPSQLTYTVPGNVVSPVAVSVNGIFLLTTEQSLDGQFTVSGNNIIFSNITVNYGDIIEIETNAITQIQQINSSTIKYQASYGFDMVSCPLNCSLYVGAPYDSTYLQFAGSVDYQTNQSRVYGITTSTIANPTLTAGGTLRINNTQVTVPGLPNNTAAGFAAAINAAGIPNVQASVSPDLTFIGDGSTQIYNIGTLYSSASAYNTVVYVADILQTYGVDYSYDNSNQNIYFTYAPIPGNTILVVSGRLSIFIENIKAAVANNLLTVLPGATNFVFNQLGFNTFVFSQQLLSPLPVNNANFGYSLSINSNAINLIVGAPNGNIYEPTTFDAGQTYFDEHSTTFFNLIPNGGVAYTYDYFPSSTKNVNNPGQFAFGQQIYNDVTVQGEKFGESVSYVTGKLMIGANGNPATNVDFPNGYPGYVTMFNNLTDTAAWAPIRYQQPVVDVYKLDGVFSYDGTQSVGINTTINGGVQTYYDFFDPLQGKILGVARENIDYIGAVDPAQYNVGSVHNVGNSWGSSHIGQMWWDTDTVRFIDPNQDDIVYASRRWGTTFPGSSVDIYQWVESSTPPSGYTGQGTPLSQTSYNINSALGSNNTFTTVYYFWVKGITTIAGGSGKTLPATGVASYILDPRSSGLPYIAALNASTVAIYNAQRLLNAKSTILSIGFDRQLNDAVVHQEYQIIIDGDADSFLNSNLYRKLLDSFCGVNSAGNPVPDPGLSLGMRYGVEFRPRQSMFADRFGALKNYLIRANNVIAQFPISETRSFELLNSEQPIPESTVTVDGVTTVVWNKEVPNLEVLSYQNLAVVPVGYKYLVLSDSSQDGLWTIYQVTASKTTTLIQVQSYYTPAYWYYINWFLPGYNSSVAPVAAVQNQGQLSTLSLATAPVGSSVRVISNGAGKWEIYLRSGIDPVTGWTRVGLEDGTIAFKEELWNYAAGNFGFDAQVFDSNYFDQTPQTETRYIIRALNEQIYIQDLKIERNSSLILMFNYVYSEFTDPSWLVKSSYVNVDHKIRSLLPYQTYIEDNQNFVIDYFQEVKPYHVQVRQFNLIYDGNDTFNGDVTDFDLPAYWKSTLEIPQFVSPILNDIPPGGTNPDGLPYDVAITTSYSTVSDTVSNAQIWQYPSIYSQWYDNYLLSLQGATVVNGGAGYTVTPIVTITGGSPTTNAIMTAIIDGTGQVIGLTVVNPGSGYISTPTITISGGNLPADPTSWSAGLAVNSNSYIITPSNNIFAVSVTGTLGNIAPAGTDDQINGTVPLVYVGTIAVATAQMGNPLIREFKINIKYDRYEYQTDIVEWAPTIFIIQNMSVGSGNGTTATLTFVKRQDNPPFPTGNTEWDFETAYTIGEYVQYLGYNYICIKNNINQQPNISTTAWSIIVITVAGVSNIDFNGTYPVTACTTTTVSYSSTATGSTTGGQATATIIADYTNGTQVRYNNKVYEAAGGAAGYVANTVFDPTEWDFIDPDMLSGVNRTMGYYVPTVNEPGLNLPLLIDGIDYPGVQVSGISFEFDTGFDRAPYDTTTFDNILYSRDGVLTYNKGILDTFFESEYLDPYLGTRPTSINVDGGKYVDVFESHAPEELVPGIEFDTLDFRVYTTPGADWLGLGHGFPQSLTQIIYDRDNPTTSFANALPTPFALEITNSTQRYDLTEGSDFTVDWPNQTFTILNSSLATVNGDQLGVYVYELGGGNQVYKNVYNGADVGNTLVVPVQYYTADGDPAIQEFVIFVNGVYLDNTNYTYEYDTFSTTVVNFDTTYTDTDFISLAVLYPTTIDAVTTDYSWSLPVTQTFVSTAGQLVFDLDNSLDYTNSVNAIVTVQGVRARTAGGIDYLGDSVTTVFEVAQRLGIDQATILDADVEIYFNDVLQDPLTYTVTPLIGGTTVTFSTAPATDIRIYIAVWTGWQARIDPIAKTLTFNTTGGLRPSLGQFVSAKTFNDTREQRLLTQIFVGPVTEGITVSEGYDTTDYDPLFIGSIVIVQPAVALTVGQIKNGFIYQINVAGTTNYTLIGASDNFVGTQFTASWGTIASTIVNNTSGVFDCDITTLYVDQTVTVSGTPSGSGTIIGYTNPTTYYITATNGVNIFTLSTTLGGPAVTTTTGATTGLVFTLNNPATGNGTVLELEVLRDPATNLLNNTTESFNYTTGATISFNDLNMTRETTDIARPWVYLNGQVLTPYRDYIITGTELVLTSGTLGPTDTVMITQITNSVVPEAMEFRLFQDMRDVQATYRMTPATTTTVTQSVTQTSDIIYVADASGLSIPNFAADIWGVVMIEGERIMYREIDLIANTISSLLRGTGGTADAPHEVGALVYNLNRDNLMPIEYQNYIVSNRNPDTNMYPVANGSQTVFVADTISLAITDAATWTPSTLSGVSISNASGKFNCSASAAPLTINQTLTISGTAGGTGSINGYSSPTTYYIIDTNGSTQFTLSATLDGIAITTVPGSLTGLTYTLNVNANTYTMGTGVVNSGFYYRAKINVPSGTALTNTTYWQPLSAAVEVYVGGARQTSGYTITVETPVEVTFTIPPQEGSAVAILVRRGVTWYNQGVGTASDGVPLQETINPGALFLQGNS